MHVLHGWEAGPAGTKHTGCSTSHQPAEMVQLNYNSDNTSAACPEVMAALIAANDGAEGRSVDPTHHASHTTPIRN